MNFKHVVKKKSKGKNMYNHQKDKALNKNILIYVLFLVAFVCAFPDTVLAALTTGKEAVEGLQQEIFAGPWVVVGKIAAPVIGLVMSLRSSSLVPIGSSIGITAAIHFFQKYTEGAAGLLLP